MRHHDPPQIKPLPLLNALRNLRRVVQGAEVVERVGDEVEGTAAVDYILIPIRLLLLNNLRRLLLRALNI